MSLQQVNLYHDELKNKKLNYSASMSLKLCLFVIVGLSAFSGFKSYQIQQQELVLQEMKNTQSKLSAEKTKIEASRKQKDTVLAKKIIRKKQELSNKQKVLSILNQDEFGNADGFSGLVGGLARQRLEGLWLTGLRFNSGGKDIFLKGITNKASLLPKYLQRLSAEKSFVGMTFKNLQMNRNKDNKQWLNFSLKNIAQVEKSE